MKIMKYSILAFLGPICPVHADNPRKIKISQPTALWRLPGQIRFLWSGFYGSYNCDLPNCLKNKSVAAAALNELLYLWWK